MLIATDDGVGFTRNGTGEELQVIRIVTPQIPDITALDDHRPL
jgi:hypothetical protein